MRDNISAKVGQLLKLFAPQYCKPAQTFLNSFAQKVMKRLIYKYNAPISVLKIFMQISSVWKYTLFFKYSRLEAW